MTPPKNTKNEQQARGKEWHLSAAKRLAEDFAGQGHKMFAKNGGKYDLLRLYGMGKQPVDKYKKLREVDESDNESVMNVDWTPRGPGIKYRDLAIEKVLAHIYEPLATPIDMQSKDENSLIYAQMKAKLLLQKAFAEAGEQDMANSPQLQTNHGEPKDLEELEMRNDFGEQFNRAKDIEQLVQLCFYDNKVPEILRPQFVQNLFDYGVAVYKDDLSPDGKPTCRVVDLRAFGCSTCRKPDFSDMTYAFELMEVSLSDIEPYFEPEEFKEISETDNHTMSNIGNGFYGQYFTRNSSMQKHKRLVMDFELFSYDCQNWDIGESRYGNIQIKSTGFKKGKIEKTVQMVYKGKWIIGTEYIYDYGLKENMKRRYSNPKKMTSTTLSYKAFAYNFHEMMCSSFGERLVPLIDDYMMVMLAAQNIRNNLVPNGFAFNLDALESVDLTMSGKNLTPKQIMSLFFKKGILMYRASKIDSQNPNLKPVEISQNSISGEIASLYNELQGIVQQMRDVTGLNEVTDGSTPSDRMLNGVASMANAATNTALMPIVRADRNLLVQLGNDLFIRVQQAVRRGGYSGFVPAINQTTMRFVEADAETSQKDYAILLEMRPTDEQKQWLMGNLQQEMANGWLDFSDAITIMNTYNMKQAQVLLAYKIKKNKEAKRQQEVENQQMTFKGQQESAQQTAQLQQQTLQLEYSLKLKLEEHITSRQIKLAEMKLGMAMQSEAQEQPDEQMAVGDEQTGFMNEDGGQMMPEKK